MSDRRITWTAGEVLQLLSMWRYGASATEIAIALNKQSRSAVLGKLNRLGLLKTRPAEVAENNLRRSLKPHTKAWKANQSAKMKAYWANPSWRSETVQAIRRGKQA